MLNVKGGFSPFYNLGNPDSSIEALKTELEMAQKALGNKKIDLYGPARRDHRLSNEQIGKNLKSLADQGFFGHVALSEVSAQTIRETHAAVPVAAVEVEFSPFTLDIEQNGILDACKELGVTVMAYAPLSRGLIGGSLKSHADLPQDFRKIGAPRFQKENLDANLKLASSFTDAAEAHGSGVTDAQLVLAWELTQYEKLVPIPGSTQPKNIETNTKAASIKLDAGTVKKIRSLADDASKNVAGKRYGEAFEGHLNG